MKQERPTSDDIREDHRRARVRERRRRLLEAVIWIAAGLLVVAALVIGGVWQSVLKRACGRGMVRVEMARRPWGSANNSGNGSWGAGPSWVSETPGRALAFKRGKNGELFKHDAVSHAAGEYARGPVSR